MSFLGFFCINYLEYVVSYGELFNFFLDYLPFKTSLRVHDFFVANFNLKSLKFTSVHCCHCYATSMPWLVICEMLILFSLNKQMILEILNEVSRLYVLMKLWNFQVKENHYELCKYFRTLLDCAQNFTFRAGIFLKNIVSGHFSSLW